MTIVAAWIRAETGVGPAMASGSQVRSGICADLPVAPMNKRTATEVSPPAKIAPQVKGSADIVLVTKVKTLWTCSPSTGLTTNDFVSKPGLRNVSA